MILENMVSDAVKNSKIYNLDHFHKAWQNPSHRRLMGNELLYPPSPKVVEAIKSMAHMVNYYAEDPGTNVELLGALANYVGIKGGAEWITMGNGSMEIIDMIPRAFINPGDEVLLPSPEYSPYARRPLIFGAKIVDVIPDKNFEYKLEDFTSKITPKTKMIILSRPNAPIGNLATRELVEGLCKTNCIVVVDEAYVEFSEQTICDLTSKFDNFIISRTFSKAMGLAGIRLGFVVANPEIIGYINRIRTNSNVGLLTQVAALAALKDAEYIRKNVQLVIKSREWFQKEIAKVAGIKVFPSKGNSVLLNVDETGKIAEDYVQYCWDKGFIIRNLSGGRNMESKGFFRVTVGTQQDMEFMAKHIADFAKK